MHFPAAPTRRPPPPSPRGPPRPPPSPLPPAAPSARAAAARPSEGISTGERSLPSAPHSPTARPTATDRPSLLCAVAVATAASRTSKTEPTSFALQLATERGHRRRTSEWREWTDGRDERARADADGRTEGGAAGRTSDAFSRADGRRGGERERGGTTASGGAAPALPVRGRKRAPPTAAAGRPQWRSITE